jgi:hypothetical protein
MTIIELEERNKNILFNSLLKTAEEPIQVDNK